MPIQQAIYAVVTFLHDLFTAVWIGGLITLIGVTLPAARSVLGKGPELKKLLNAVQTRLSGFVYISMAGLALTGMLLARRNPEFEGLLSTTNAFSAVLALKHVLVLLMIAVGLYRSLALVRKQTLTPPQEKLSMVLLLVNLAAGILVLLVTGFSVAVPV